MKENLLKGLTEEQLSKAKECKNIDEFKVFAKNEGIKLSDDDLENAAGGGFFSNCSRERYEEAGVEVIGWGYLYNDGYRLKASGEELSWSLANHAVYFCDAKKRPATSIAEIERWLKEKDEEIAKYSPY